MLAVKINGEKYAIPTQLRELTLGQFFALRDAKDIIDEVCALTGLERSAVSNFATKSDLQKCYAAFTPIGAELSKLSKTERRELPKEVTINGRVITVPKSLKLEPVGAFIAVNDILATEHNKNEKLGLGVDYTDVIPQVLAHYFFIHYNGGLYDDELAESENYLQAIKTIPITDAIPIANFFFRKFPNL